MSAIDDARQLLENRLAELNTERESLERALVELGGGKPRKRRGRPAGKAAAAPTGAKKASAKKRRRRKGGTRADQTVELITSQPGISASDVAKKMGINPNYLYRVLGDLEKQGRVKKDGRNYQPV